MKKERYLSRIIPLLKEEGLEVSMESIAESVGITKKTLYNNFSSKDELIDCCVEILFAEFREKVSPLSDANIDPREGFRRGVEGLMHFFRDCSHTFLRDLNIFYPNMASSTHLNGTKYFEARLKDNIERGMARGIFRKDLDAFLFSRYIAVSIFGFFQREVMRTGDFTAAHYFEQVIEFNLNALLSRDEQL